MQHEMKWPGAGATATGPMMSKRPLRHLHHNATVPAGEAFPDMLSRHLGAVWLSGWTAGRSAQ
jgi:hypothetical protein